MKLSCDWCGRRTDAIYLVNNNRLMCTRCRNKNASVNRRNITLSKSNIVASNIITEDEKINV